MRSLIENVFRKQLKQLHDKIGRGASVVISFDYSSDTFNYNVSILTGIDNGEQYMDNITEENIKRIVDLLINRYEERQCNHDEIRMSDFGGPVPTFGNTIDIRDWSGEIRDTGEAVGCAIRGLSEAIEEV